MNTPGLFIAGVFVTLILMGAVALLCYAAVLDGRGASQQDLAAEDEMRTRPEPRYGTSSERAAAVESVLAPTSAAPAPASA